jgi:hypothetical protein
MNQGVKVFFEANMPQEKILRFTSQGTLNPPLGYKNIDKARWAKKNAKVEAA